jgi:hypothetical protein
MPPPAHDQHDRLLVAQLVAGDPLDEAELAQAHAWLASCPDCQSLAADLRVLPAIVAQEPVPPRRRDFRLSPEQAEQLSGNVFTRSLLRLSLPRGRAFAPAAGAVMSIGLVFVVAGYAWPDGGSVAVEQEVITAPAASLAAPPGEVDAVPSLGRAAFEAFAVESSPAPEEPGAAAVEEGLAADRLAPRERSLAASDGDASEAVASAPVGDDQSAITESLEQGVLEQGSEADTAAIEEPAAAASLEMGAPETMAMVAEASVAPTAAKTGSDDVLAADEMRAPDGGEAATAGTALAEAEGSDDGPRLLMLVGVALALGGGALLLLSWLVRRSSDPLLR